MHIRHHQNGTLQSLILERSRTQYGAMVTKLLGLYCDTHSVESYCKKIKHFRWKLAEIFFFFVHHGQNLGRGYDVIKLQN